MHLTLTLALHRLRRCLHLLGFFFCNHSERLHKVSQHEQGLREMRTTRVEAKMGCLLQSGQGAR